MKFVQELNRKMTTRAVLMLITKTPTINSGVSYDEMVKRLRLIDTINQTAEDADGFLFEDEDWNVLTKLARSFPYGMVDQDLADVVTGILEAKKPEKKEEPEKMPPKKIESKPVGSNKIAAAENGKTVQVS